MRQLGERLPSFRNAGVQAIFSDSVPDGLLKKVHIWFEVLMSTGRLEMDHGISDKKKLGYWHLG
jgi:hypothetical protein